MNLKKKIIISLAPLIIILSVVFTYDFPTKFIKTSDKSLNEKERDDSNAVFTFDFKEDKKSETTEKINRKTQALMAKDTYIQIMKKVIDQFEIIDSKKINQDEYGQLLIEGLKTFPEKSILKKLDSKEAHQFPEPISLAGEFLGIIKKHLKENPDLNKPAKNFYTQCAQKKDLTSSIRALCLVNLKEMEIEHGQSLDLSQFDSKIVELAKFLELKD